MSEVFPEHITCNERRIRTALSKCDEAGVLQVDKRGSHSNHYSEADQEELVIQHIKCSK